MKCSDVPNADEIADVLYAASRPSGSQGQDDGGIASQVVT